MLVIDQFFGQYRFLSNFWRCQVELDGVIYPSVEHAYVASKTLDLELRKEILGVEKAGEVKRIGKKIVLRDDWEEVRLGIMEDLVRQKFQQEPIKTQLKATFPDELIESNTWNDVFWGVCKGIGHNHLGKILMKVRKEILTS